MPGIDPAILAQYGNTQAYPGSPASPVARTPDGGAGPEGGEKPLSEACEMACAQLQECAATMDALQGQAEMSDEDIDPAVEQMIADAAAKVADANDAMTQVMSQLSGGEPAAPAPAAAPPKGPPAV